MTQQHPTSYYHTGVNGSPAGMTGLAARPAWNFGAMGAIVGGALAAAQAIPKVKNNQINASQAVGEVFKEAAGTGVATAAGACVAGAVSLGGFTSLLAMFGVATGVKYLWNSAFGGGEPQPAPVEVAPETPAPAKAKAAKTTAKK